MRLEGRRILVVGASRGIGRAIALACAREGATVGVHYRAARSEAERVAGEIAGIGPAPALVSFDVRDEPGVAAGFSAFGEIDALVQCAGVTRPALLATASLDDLREVLDVNLTGAVLCARAVLPSMLTRRRGVILLVSSVAAVRPFRGQAVYAAAKAGVEALTRALAVEYGRKGIRVVCLRPGPVDTEMLESTRRMAGEELVRRVPLGRIARPEEVAGLAVHLLSDEAAFVTGSVHPIDGGYLEA